MARKKSRARKSGKSGWVPAALLVVTLGLVAVFAGSAALKAFRGDSEGEGHARASAPAPRSAESRAARRATQVEIWNGSGSQGAGQQVAEALRDGGFHVLEVRTADRNDYGATLVVDRKGNRGAAEEVVKYLHGGYPIEMRSLAATADVRVIVGRDHEGLSLAP